MFLVVAAHETVATVDVPYCTACAAHARAFERGTFRGLFYPTIAILVAGFFIGMAGLIVNSMGNKIFDIMWMGAFPAALAALFVSYRVVARMRAAPGRGHTTAAPVLEIRSWSDRSFLLDCGNARYATLLRQANTSRPPFAPQGA